MVTKEKETQEEDNFCPSRAFRLLSETDLRAASAPKDDSWSNEKLDRNEAKMWLLLGCFFFNTQSCESPKLNHLPVSFVNIKERKPNKEGNTRKVQPFVSNGCKVSTTGAL